MLLGEFFEEVLFRLVRGREEGLADGVVTALEGQHVVLDQGAEFRGERGVSVDIMGLFFSSSGPSCVVFLKSMTSSSPSESSDF